MSTMIPVRINDGDKSDEYKPGMNFRSKLLLWIRQIFSDDSSRNLFCFLLLNLSFAFVELAYGIWTNSLGLISDSFHMFFDCTALMAGVVASVISRWKKNERYSYGYVRVEVLAGFVNALFLLFIGFFILSEAMERVFHPPHVEHERLFVISVLGFIVNLIGIFVFHHGGDCHGHSHGGGSHGHSHGGHSRSHVEHEHSFANSLQHNHLHGGENHGHLHGGGNHGHSHGGGNHGHSHGGESHGHSHGGESHGHSHGGESHGHSHGGGNHGHSHGGGNHGHSHGGGNHGHSTGGESHGHLHGGGNHGHSHGLGFGDSNHLEDLPSSSNQIIQGVFLHVLADTLGSVGVIISAGLIKMFGWMLADPICSLFIAVLITISVIPLLKESVGILMQRIPLGLEKDLHLGYQRVYQIEGVHSIQDPHFWTLCSGIWVGNLRLLVAPATDTQRILSQCHKIFSQLGVKQLYVQVEFSS
ncbi:zinc transporter 7-like [Xenia sp. Carnegie-2017]|uniref:zinc transporter 7-like n=1 Tax=Xenia sp. Carnegie-2017 TaxID=2897299 RepID=UPI001F03CD1B|nr:zinc transporter 7-like [Xenia sp. Carnegie-2017]